jgi:ribosomal protein L11 methyltransferase
MTNYGLTTGPLPRLLADAAASMLEDLPAAPALAVSLIDRGEPGWEVEAHYAAKAAASRAAAALQNLAIAAHAIAVSPLPDIDWVERSLEGLPPVTAGRFFIHGSHHLSIPPPAATAIVIDAATAFGTGHHATTRGCLLALDCVLRRESPRHALDIGCGTGVLAIAFARATRRPALAIDIDPEAVRVTRDNARRNGVGGRVRLLDVSRSGSAVITGSYDFVFANLLASPLLRLAPEIARLTARGGTAVLSGLYGGQDRRVEAIYRLAGFRMSFRLSMEDWTTLVLSAARHPREASRM